MAGRPVSRIASVTHRREFAELARARAHGRRRGLWVRHLPADDADVGLVRVAYATPATIGSAVVRNRLRRRLRAHVRSLVARQRMAPGGYLIGVTPAAAGSDFDELGVALETALDQATGPVAERRAS